MATAVYGHLGGGHVEIVWQPQPGDPPDTCIWWGWYQLGQAVLSGRRHAENAIRDAAWNGAPPRRRVRWKVPPWARAISAYAGLWRRRHCGGFPAGQRARDYWGLTPLQPLDWFGDG